MLHVLNVYKVCTARCCVLLMTGGGRCSNVPCPERVYRLHCTVLCVASEGAEGVVTMLHVLNVSIFLTARFCVLLLTGRGPCSNAPCPENDYRLHC